MKLNPVLKILPLLFALFLFSFPARSAEKIEGAFGIKLGQIYQPEASAKKTIKEDGGVMYTFTPATKFSSLQVYTVTVSPKTSKVFMILAMGVTNYTAATEERDRIVRLLEEKYGPKVPSADDGFHGRAQITQGARLVRVQTDSIGTGKDCTLSLAYVDSDLLQTAQKEHRSDTSGL